MRAVALSNPMAVVKNSAGLKQLLECSQLLRETGATVEYIWGPTGSGKTRMIYQRLCKKYLDIDWDYPQPIPRALFDFVYVKTPTASSSGTQWFSLLNSGHKTMVFEEFSSSSSSLTFITSLINPGPCFLPAFGTMVSCLVSEVIILSNHDPVTLWPGVAEEARAAFLRRLKDPHVGKILFRGYGPNHDLPFCPCQQMAQCAFSHDVSGPIAHAAGVKLPPPGGYLFKPPV